MCNSRSNATLQCRRDCWLVFFFSNDVRRFNLSLFLFLFFKCFIHVVFSLLTSLNMKTTKQWILSFSLDFFFHFFFFVCINLSESRIVKLFWKQTTNLRREKHLTLVLTLFTWMEYIAEKLFKYFSITFPWKIPWEPNDTFTWVRRFAMRFSYIFPELLWKFFLVQLKLKLIFVSCGHFTVLYD